jgi:hypothetical protein
VLGAIIVSAAVSALAGPQHWGFGFGYLVTIEQNEKGERALSVYEPPMRVKDGEWLLRWRDTSDQYKDVLPNGLAVGNFWPEAMGSKEYVVALTATEGGPPMILILDPAEVFSTRSWKVLAQAPLPGWPQGAQVIATAAGDVLGTKRAQLVVLAWKGNDEVLYVWVPGAGADQPWTLSATRAWPRSSPGPVRDERNALTGATVADFWGAGTDSVLLRHAGENYSYSVVGLGEAPAGGIPRELNLSGVCGERVRIPAGELGALVACDFLKDGFAYCALVARDRPEIEFRTAPRLADKLFNTCWVRADETFAGAKLTDQKVGESRQIMTGKRQAPFGKVVAAGAGRVFGYITAGVEERKQKLWKPWQYHGYNDVEIAFAHRTPVYKRGMPKKWQDAEWPWEPDDHYGWPFKDEEVTYEVSLKNNGPEPIPPGKVTLSAWVNTPDRNADILPADVASAPGGRRGEGEAPAEPRGRGSAGASPSRPNFEFTINEPIPPFDPAKPQYTVVKVPLKWPYDLEQPPGWTWKRINVRQVGERWLVLRADYDGDENERNNRYELALNSLLFRPVWRFDVDAPPHPSPDGLEGRPDRKINTLAYRAPVVGGDPESKEYNGRKLADAVQCMWERSRTSDGGDIWQRVVFDSYRLSDSQGRGGLKPNNRAEDWLYYEGPRDGEHWVGLWGDYERFDPRDGGAELHETGHLFHPVGDLYHYFINPTVTRRARMADGSSVQMNTYCWGLDSFCSGHAIIGEADSDYQRYMEGARLGLGAAWHRMLPKKINVRVLDRDGQPVPGAKVSFWPYGEEKPFSTGATDAKGCWDPGINKKPGDVYDIFNFPQYQDQVLDAIGHILTVDLDGYSDFMIWGAEDVAAHSRYTLLQACIKHPEEWTWDFKTLYKAGAAKPAFHVIAAVQGREIMLNVLGSPSYTYNVYRRWEPTYTFEKLGEMHTPDSLRQKYDDSVSPPVQFRDDMGAADWYMKGRYRAAYYITEVANGVESLPKRVYGIALDRVNGVSDLGDGKLMVAANCGKSEPFGILCQGTTPVEETMKHFRFGHTAAKIVRSQANPQHYYATLTSSDLPGMDRFFDLIQFDKPDRHNDTYPVVQTIAECDVTQFSTATPYKVTIRPDPGARTAINAGDWAFADETRARILAVDEGGTKLTLDKPLFKEGQKGGLHLKVEFGGGTPGDKAELRELKNPRGLAVIKGDDGKEYIVIADTGNGRIVVWDATTRYVAQADGASLSIDGFRAAAIAAHPKEPATFLVLDRRADRQSAVHLLRFAGGKLTRTMTAILASDVGDGENGPEIGLAAEVEPKSGTVWIAVTDAQRRSVLSHVLTDTLGGEFGAPLTQLSGAFVGEAKLTNPTDVAYTVENGELRLYAVDGHNRIVRLR